MSSAQPPFAVEPVAYPKFPEVTVYGHSPLFYWWPIWATGYIMALITYFDGVRVQFADATVIIDPSKALGVVFTVIFLLVILMTNAAVRGTASLTVIVSILALTFFFAFMGWWDSIFRAISGLAMFMNLGFYVFFSTALFVIWALSVFIFDRFEHWTFRPGQAVHHMFMGGGEQTYDTQGMSVFKLRSDLFRHWVLGMGSGDLHIATTGAKPQEFVVPNVLFIGTKLRHIEELVSMKPNEFVEDIRQIRRPA
jgi:hypothetical protein